MHCLNYMGGSLKDCPQVKLQNMSTVRSKRHNLKTKKVGLHHFYIDNFKQKERMLHNI